MRVQVEQADNLGTTPRSLYWDGRRIAIVDIIDQWYGLDHRYVKAKGDDGGVYILRFDEIRNEWAMVMFVSVRSQVLAMQAA